jgi:hypothetical protein
MLDEQTITLNAFAGATMGRRIRRTILSLVSLVVLLTVGTGAAYMTLVSHPERTNIKQAALLPNPIAALTRARPCPPGKLRPGAPRTSC